VLTFPFSYFLTSTNREELSLSTSGRNASSSSSSSSPTPHTQDDNPSSPSSSSSSSSSLPSSAGPSRAGVAGVDYIMREKEYKKLAFEMASRRYEELRPILERLNELEAEQVGR